MSVERDCPSDVPPNPGRATKFDSHGMGKGHGLSGGSKGGGGEKVSPESKRGQQGKTDLATNNPRVLLKEEEKAFENRKSLEGGNAS